MKVFTFLFAWQKRKSNGFVLTECLAALAIMTIITASLLPLLVQAAANCRYGESWEELSRQGMVLEETVFGMIRFAQKIESVSSKTIRCRDEQNGLTGFTVKNGRVYRILSNGNEQPLTGSANADPRKERICVQLQENTPYFSTDGKAVHVHIELYDRHTGQSWPCIITVVPLSVQWERET